MADIPNKRYFRIGEVHAITGIPPHVLRYWEAEFKILRPQRASSKQRLYRQADLENILTIKQLLYEKGFTIPGARKHLAQQERSDITPASTSNSRQDLLKEIRIELESIRDLLEKDQ